MAHTEAVAWGVAVAPPGVCVAADGVAVAPPGVEVGVWRVGGCESTGGEVGGVDTGRGGGGERCVRRSW